MQNQENNYELIKFADGDFSLDVRVSQKEETVWLSIEQISLLFDRDKKTIRKHADKTLKMDFSNPTVAKFEIVQKEGDRIVKRQIIFYSLEIILYIGNCVKSPRTIKFENWAKEQLKNIKKIIITNFRR